MAEDKILGRVRKLLDRANHPNTNEHEREACLQQADKLMVKHAIDEAFLDNSRSDEDKRKPRVEKFHAADPDSIWYIKFRTILAEIARTVRVRSALHWNGDITVVGFPDDLFYFQELWTRIYFDFLSKMDPKWDNNLSFEHNVYNFKKAGTKWNAIRDIAVQNDNWVDWPDGGRLVRAYKRHCKILGEEPTPHTQRHAAYRESFAEGFVQQICMRLEKMREASYEQVESSGAELVFYNSKERVDEVFYREFPGLDPETIRKQSEEFEKQQREAQERHEEWLASLSPKERAKYEREQEQERQRMARESRRYWRQAARERDRLWDPAGKAAGHKAGEESDLGRSKAKVDNNKRGELR